MCPMPSSSCQSSSAHCPSTSPCWSGGGTAKHMSNASIGQSPSGTPRPSPFTSGPAGVRAICARLWNRTARGDAGTRVSHHGARTGRRAAARTWAITPRPRLTGTPIPIWLNASARVPSNPYHWGMSWSLAASRTLMRWSCSRFFCCQSRVFPYASGSTPGGMRRPSALFSKPGTTVRDRYSLTRCPARSARLRASASIFVHAPAMSAGTNLSKRGCLSPTVSRIHRCHGFGPWRVSITTPLTPRRPCSPCVFGAGAKLRPLPHPRHARSSPPRFTQSTSPQPAQHPLVSRSSIGIHGSLSPRATEALPGRAKCPSGRTRSASPHEAPTGHANTKVRRRIVGFPKSAASSTWATESYPMARACFCHAVSQRR